MTRLAGLSALFAGLMAVGCGVGGEPGTVPGPTMDPNGRVCGSTLVTAGSFAPDAANPIPAGWNGCWPVGMWTFTATVAANDCTAPPSPLAQYKFQGTVSLDMNGDPLQAFAYLTDPSARNILKVSEGGSGLCEGELDLFSADGKSVWLLKPELNADNSITGDGEFGLFTTDQFPGA